MHVLRSTSSWRVITFLILILASGVFLSEALARSRTRAGQRVSATEMNANDVGVSWLPLYHDMGLIGNVLQPMFVGARCILMSPTAFLQSPVRWLQAVSRYRATTSGGPSFAYELCVNKISPEQRATLNLSSWSVAYNGAEPIRAETLERFAEVFGPCGFRREAFLPCYGLAEATLVVSSGSKSSAPALGAI